MHIAKLTPEQKTIMLDSLEWLYYNHESPDISHFGICTNLGILPEMEEVGLGLTVVGLIPYYSKDWPHNSGDNGYPIPGGFECYCKGGRWEGKQLEYRLDLLRHLYMTISEEC